MSGPLDDVHRWQAAAPDRVIGDVQLAPGVALPDIVRLVGVRGIRRGPTVEAEIPD